MLYLSIFFKTKSKSFSLGGKDGFFPRVYIPYHSFDFTITLKTLDKLENTRFIKGRKILLLWPSDTKRKEILF